MLLSPGTRIGPYEVVAPIGSGGMGEVYRARDSKLQRDVALKIIPPAFAADPDRLARFGREAQLLAALNHPNIAHIYGIEDAGSAPALVLELVEGPTLADRLSRGAIPLTEALRIALQIALALEAAHDHSIIHRDLKPANVKVRDDGAVKVLDFGLAKAFEPQPSTAGDVANSPTLTNRATALGVILGTAAYMAPEQAKGKAVDKRADIWSFGVVLFEMLSGRRLFAGDDVSDTLAEVLKTTPDWDALPASTPPAIGRLLRRCLDRDLKSRLHDIADARLEIEDVLAAPAPVSAAPARALGRRERFSWLAAVVAAAAIASAATVYLRPAAPAAPETRLHLAMPPPGSTVNVFTPIALSPDGRTLAFWARTGGKTQMWIRPLGAETAHALPGADGNAAGLAWSPDGRSILFIDGGTLREVSVVDGTSHALPVRGVGFGMTRNADGLLLFAPANAAPILRVPLSGGTPEPATEIAPPQVGHRFPYFLPDGRHFLFLVSGPPDVQGIFLGTLGSLEARRLVEADTAAVFAPPDFVVFGRQDAIFAQRLNLGTLELEGEAIPVADRVAQARGVFGSVVLTAGANGTIAYRQATPPVHRLTWFDRTGKRIGVVGEPNQSEVDGPPRLSPDGKTILLARRVDGNTDIWSIANMPQGALQRFTSNPWIEMRPVWSPDGSHVAFQSSRKGGGFYDLYRRSVGGASEDGVILESADNKTMNDWSLDNRFLLYIRQGREQVPRDVWAMPVDGGPGLAVTSSPHDEVNARFSPDSRWVAYQSNAAGGGYEVYVRPFPGPGREWRISSGGGTTPSWRGDGRELYYIGPNDTVMAVPITLPAAGDAIEHGAAARLFSVRGASFYTPAPEGTRFLVNEILEDSGTPPITVIVNWRRQ